LTASKALRVQQVHKAHREAKVFKDTRERLVQLVTQEFKVHKETKVLKDFRA
jgi:hypothetical protein